jgi:hypothetical protein
MLGPDDAIVPCDGVRVDGNVVVDDVLGRRYPANDAALFVLARAGMPLGAVARELAARHGLDDERARNDVLSFALALNRALLANVVHGTSRLRRVVSWLALALRLAPAGVVPASLAVRFRLDTSTVPRALCSTIAAAGRRATALGAVGTTVALQPALTASPRASLGALALGMGVGVGVAMHEASHAVTLVGVGAVLVIAGPRIRVAHPALSGRRRALVAAAGPVGAALTGVVIVGLGLATRTPELALAGCGPAAHAVGVTVATAEGRTACGL